MLLGIVVFCLIKKGNIHIMLYGGFVLFPCFYPTLALAYVII